MSYVKNDGTIQIYDQTKYNKTFYEKHKDEFKTKILCVCGRYYLKSNKSNHDKTKLHEQYIKLTTGKNANEFKIIAKEDIQNKIIDESKHYDNLISNTLKNIE